jgi:hypothetical protein
MPAYPNNRHAIQFGGSMRYARNAALSVGLAYSPPEPEYDGEDPDISERREVQRILLAARNVSSLRYG